MRVRCVKKTSALDHYRAICVPLMNRPLQARLDNFRNSFSFVGVVFTSLFFARFVTPTRLPRVDSVHVVLLGLAMAIGYVVGERRCLRHSLDTSVRR